MHLVRIAAGLTGLAVLFLAPMAAQATGCDAPWKASAVYTAGMEASQAGVNYKANYWTEGDSPMSNNGADGQPWSEIGICAKCSVKPTVPTGLTAVATSDTKTDLIWQASRAPLNCKIGSYTVFENGMKLGTATGNNLAVGALAPSTAYRFSVAASDEVGGSASSKAAAVTTAAAGQGRGPAALYAPYIDMSQTKSENLLAISKASTTNHFTLAFVLSPGACEAAWGGVGTIAKDQMPDGRTIQSLVNGLRAAGGDVVISFGGEAGQEPALVCKTVASLRGVYQKVVDRYKAKLLDFDIEGGAVLDRPSLTLRDKALVGLRKANPGLTISYTLPVLPTGLDDNGVALLKTAKADGLEPDIVNVMTMDYGGDFDSLGGTMAARAIAAANNTALQIKAAGLTSRVGITPMIGVNDDNAEVFTPADAASVLSFAAPNPDIARIAMWSVNRDNGGCAGAKYASDTCSSLKQAPYAFARQFSSFNSRTAP
jgi:chitodextrinase